LLPNWKGNKREWRGRFSYRTGKIPVGRTGGRGGGFLDF
jgi:hypothetical protein